MPPRLHGFTLSRDVSMLAVIVLDLSRVQFALTTLFHFTFVPLTLGLASVLAIMQTLAYRTKDERWEHLVRFFGVLFLINFAIGESGAGKTTVTRLLFRFLDPECGRVTIGGRDVRDMRQEDVRGVFAL